MLTSKLNLILAASLLFTGAIRCFAQSNPGEQTQKWVAVLKSEAPQKEKADACRELALIGTKDAVSALAELLRDEKLSHMARYALETIPDPMVDAALRRALEELGGNSRQLVGVIGSLGVRRDALAVEKLKSLLYRDNAEVVAISARTLGNIGTSAAAKALMDAWANTPAPKCFVFAEGLFRAAEALVAKGQQAEAIAIYDRLRNSQAPHQIRAGALRGAILARQEEGLALLRKSLRSDDFVVFDAALRTGMEIPGSEVTQALIQEYYGRQSTDKKILIIQEWGRRGDVMANEHLQRAAGSSAQPKAIRVAALRALAEIGAADAVEPLVAALDDKDQEISQAALESLAGLPGKEMDGVVSKMLARNETSQKLTGIELAGRRRMVSSLPALLKAAEDNDAKVRSAAYKKLGELATPAELPALLQFLGRSQDLDAAEQAISALCARVDKPEQHADPVIAALAPAKPALKCALLRILGVMSGEKALKTVLSALDDANPEVRDASLRVLCAWKTAEAAPEVLKLAKSAKNDTEKKLCLRSYLDWARNSDQGADKQLAMCREAVSLAQSTDEKKLLLGALGGIDSPEALAAITPYLESESTAEDAATAIVTISDKLLKSGEAKKLAPKLLEPLQKVQKASPSANLAKRAAGLLKQAQTTAGQ